MALTEYAFESGSNGDALTAGNTGFDSVVISGSGTSGVISTAQAAHGTRSGLFTKSSASGTCYIQKTVSTTSATVRIYIRMTALPSADQTVIWLGNGSSQRANVEITSGGAIRFRDDGNTARWISGGATTSVGTMTTNTWYRIEFYANMGTGAARLVVYPGDSTTPVTNMDSGAWTGVNFGADSYTAVRVGTSAGTGTTTLTAYLDAVGIEDAATGLVGPYAVTLDTPVVTLGTTTNPSTVGGSDGSQVVTWAAISGAASYDAYLATEATPDQGDFVLEATGVTSPYTFTGLSEGVYAFGIQAKE